MARILKKLTYLMIMTPLLYRLAWNAPRDHATEFALYSRGIAECMPAGMLRYSRGVRDWLLIYFYDAAKAGGVNGVMEVPARSLMVWKPGEVRVYGSEAGAWRHSWLQVTGRRVVPVLQAAGISAGRPRAIVDAALIEHGIRELHGEATTFDPPSPRILGNLFENWILRIVRKAGGGEGERGRRLRALKLHLDTHSSASMSLAEMARRAGMSSSHLSALFRDAYGESPVAYHIFRRIETAQYLLSHRGLGISEVAEQTGYPDLPSFSRMFKRVTGVAPREYRRSRVG